MSDDDRVWVPSSHPCGGCGGELLHTYTRVMARNDCPHCLQGECAGLQVFCTNAEILFPIEHVSVRAMS